MHACQVNPLLCSLVSFQCVPIPQTTPNASLSAFVLPLAYFSEVHHYVGGWVHGIDAEPDCSNCARYHIFVTIDFSNVGGTVASILSISV